MSGLGALARGRRCFGRGEGGWTDSRPPNDEYTTTAFVYQPSKTEIKSQVINSDYNYVIHRPLLAFDGIRSPIMRKRAPRRQPGRPPLGDTSMQQTTLRLPKPMLAAIDELLVGRLDQPDRSTIIRELLAEALQARAKKAGR